MRDSGFAVTSSAESQNEPYADYSVSLKTRFKHAQTFRGEKGKRPPQSSPVKSGLDWDRDQRTALSELRSAQTQLGSALSDPGQLFESVAGVSPRAAAARRLLAGPLAVVNRAMVSH